MANEVLNSAFTRVFVIDGRAGPANTPVYKGLVRAGAPVYPQGAITTIRIPDPDAYGAFKRVGRIRGAPDDPQLPITGRYGYETSDILRLVRQGCEVDLQVHIGLCQDPRDFNRGWDKILVLEGGTADQWSTDGDLGALGPDEQTIVNEQTTFFGLDLYEITKVRLASIAQPTLVSSVTDVIVCDRISCGSCGIPSDGCDKIFALQATPTGSPTGPAQVIYSSDGGGVWGTSYVNSLNPGEASNALGCVGSFIVVVSQGSSSIHVASLTALLAGTGTWTEVTTGFTNAPKAITAQGPSAVWIVGVGGYIYFTDNVEDGVEVQSAGGATVQDLNAVHAFDALNVVAVGASNAVVRTTDGVTWSAIVGPAVGVTLNTVVMHGVDEWFVGAANGNLYYTRDGGSTWTLKGFSGSGAGQVKDIVFSTPTVGFMVHNLASGVGRVFRTIDGGQSWYQAPESQAATPTNTGFNSVAVCSNVNIAFIGGANSTDGILIKAS